MLKKKAAPLLFPALLVCRVVICFSLRRRAWIRLPHLSLSLFLSFLLGGRECQKGGDSFTFHDGRRIIVIGHADV